MLGYYILGISSPYGFFCGSIFNLHVSNQEHNVSLVIQSLPLIVGLLGMVLGAYIYKGSISSSISNKMKFTYYLLKNKFFFDEIYNKLFISTTKFISYMANMFDIKIINHFGPNGFSFMTRVCSWCVCQIQTGYIFNYAFYIIFAMVLCVTIFVANYLLGAWGI
jgi:NADH-quinone oxidoreductase subunit L